MGAYPLANLLTLRKLREDAAEREARRARAAEAEAKNRLEEAKAELARYREWRPGEEKRLFAELRGRVIEQSRLDRHREDIEGLRKQELVREETCLTREKELKEAGEALEKAKRAKAAAVRGREKIAIHRDRWQISEAKRLEAAEEAELEEFKTRAAEEDEAAPDDA